MEPLFGLMPHAEPVPGSAALEPGLGAAADVGLEIRRYGGWSWNRDRLPLSRLKYFQTQKQDFSDDVLLTTGAGHALLTGNAALLRLTLDRCYAEQIDFSHLAHSLPGVDGLLYDNGLHESKEAYRDLVKYPGTDGLLATDRRNLQASGATLAALAMGLQPGADISDAQKQKIQQGHAALAFFLAAQPGLFVIPAHDALGVLPPGQLPKESHSRTDEPDQTPVGGVNLLGERNRIQISQRGVVALPALYPGLDLQAADKTSFLTRLGELAAMRDRTGVAAGRYAGRIKTDGKGLVITATVLPDNKGIMLAATNFSRDKVSGSVPLSAVPQPGTTLTGAKLVDPFSGKSLGPAGSAISFNLPGWGVKAVVVQPKGVAPLGGTGLEAQTFAASPASPEPAAGNNAAPAKASEAAIPTDGK